jgi:hypothetical protein
MKKTKLLQIDILIAIFIMSITLTSCDLTGPEPVESLDELISPENEFIPLAVGNYWVYEQWYYGDPTWLDTVRNEILFTHDIIVENTKVHAYGIYRFRYDERPREDALVPLAANGPEGYYILGSRTPTDSLYKLNEGLRYKYPASIGDTWEYTQVIYNRQSGEFRLGNTRTIQLIDTTKTVETPAGDFENCYVYRFNDFYIASTLIHYFYIKPMIGIVGVDTYVADDDLYGQQRLLEYEINGKP